MLLFFSSLTNTHIYLFLMRNPKGVIMLFFIYTSRQNYSFLGIFLEAFK